MNLENYYGVGSDLISAKNRIDALSATYKKGEGKDPQYIFSSSGRSEILGNHTDHNHGKVLVAAISCDVLAAVGKTDDDTVTVYSEGYSPIKVNLSDLSPKKINL